MKSNIKNSRTINRKIRKLDFIDIHINDLILTGIFLSNKQAGLKILPLMYFNNPEDEQSYSVMPTLLIPHSDVTKYNKIKREKELILPFLFDTKNEKIQLALERWTYEKEKCR